MDSIGLYWLASLLSTWLFGACAIDTGYSTRTAYRNCSLQPFLDDKLNIVNDCNLIHTTGLFRHGTRTPSKSQCKDILELFNKLKSSASTGLRLPKDLLTHPVPFQDSEPERRLIKAGYSELESLGQWIKDLGNQQGYAYTLENTEFYASTSDRAIESGRAFYNGLFDYPSWFDLRKNCNESSDGPECDVPGYANYQGYLNKLKEHISINNTLLRFYDSCPRYTKEVKDNKTALAEYNKFKDSKVIDDILKEFVKKFNLKDGYGVNDLRTIFLVCAFELAANFGSNKTSPWCELMSTDFLVALEYMEDVKQYWIKSYPYLVSYQQACPTLNFLIDGLKQVAEEFKQNRDDFKRGRFLFGHAETLFPIVTLLGMFNASIGSNTTITMTADDGFKRRKELVLNPNPPPNTFRASYISPFAGNIVFKLYHCPNKGSEDEFYVLPLVNGRSVAWPMAGDVQPPTLDSPGGTLASLRRVVQEYQHCSPPNYDQDAVCALPRGAANAELFDNGRLLIGVVLSYCALHLPRMIG